MKRRRHFIIAFGCVTALISVLLLWPHEREPEYNGVTLSTWLLRCVSTNQAESVAAADAVHHIGTNALPFLIRRIQYEPGWRDFVVLKVFNWPVIRGRNVQCLIWTMTGTYRANTAVTGFGILGSQANPVLPELQRMAENPKAPETATRATHCMILMTQRFRDIDDSRY